MQTAPPEPIEPPYMTLGRGAGLAGLELWGLSQKIAVEIIATKGGNYGKHRESSDD
jgi:hypothetical protein